MRRLTDRADGVSFSYPAAWRAQLVGNRDMQQVWIVAALSNERLHAPCRQTGPNSTSCGFRVMLPVLRPGGVFVTWTLDYMPMYAPARPADRLAGYPGNPTRIAGVPAKILGDGTGAAIPSFCPKLTTASITAFLVPPQGRPPVIMAACARTANFDRFRAQVRTMLRSTSLKRG